MSLLRNVARGLRSLFRKEQVDRELNEELGAYLEMAAAEKMKDGMSHKDALRTVRLERGSLEVTKEVVRSAGWESFVESSWQDVRYALRVLRKSPGFTATAVLTLSLGVGANTAIFSMVDWLILRPLPVKDPSQLTYLVVQDKDGRYSHGFSNPNFEDIRQQTTSIFSYVAGIQPFQMDGLNVDGSEGRIWTNYVSGDFFEMLGVRPALGRFILPSDGGVSDAAPVLVIGYSCWQERFGGESDIIGKKVAVNGHAVRIIGVTPEGFHGALAILDTQGYLPLGMAGTNWVEKKDSLTDRQEGEKLLVLARLKPGVSLAQAHAALDVVAKRLAQQYPKIDDWKSMRASPLGAAPPSDSPSDPLPSIAGIFLFLAGLVLLLSCVNIANLLLVRACVRSREMAVRSALGAPRVRLIRQLFTESVLLALLGCAGGIALGFGGSRALSINLGSAIPFVLDFGLTWRVLLYSVGAALLTGILVGFVPALRASRINLIEVLHEGSRSSTIGRQRWRSVLVVAEVGGSLMLLIVAGLFVRSMQMVQHVDLGFDPNHVLNFSMDPHEAGYDAAKGSRFFQDLLSRVRSAPRVQSASIAASVPMGYYDYASSLKIDRYQPKDQKAPHAGYNAVSPSYFETMRIPLLRGRDFLDSDDQSSPRVAIINEAMAREYWTNQDPVGHSFALEDDLSHPVQIVGICKDSRTGSISDRIGPYFYLPFLQNYLPPMTLQVRAAAADQASMIHGILEIIRVAEPSMPVFDVQTMTRAVDTINGLLLFQMGAGLAGALGALGLILAVVGVYGVVSYSASQRTQEIGIRRALGASSTVILKMVFRQGLVIIAAGVALGVLLAAAISQLIRNLLVGVQPLDPLAYVSASFLLALVIFGACYIPARRAMRVDPMVALRYE